MGVLQGTVGSTLQHPGVLQGTVAVPAGVPIVVSIIVLSVSCGHYSLLSDCPIPNLLLMLLLLQTPLLKNAANCCAVAALTWFSEIAKTMNNRVGGWGCALTKLRREGVPRNSPRMR